MAYTETNYKSKKALKEAVAAHQASLTAVPEPDVAWGTVAGLLRTPGTTTAVRPVRCGPDLDNYTGRISLEGPHYPGAHTWYASAELVDGIVVKVK